MEYSKELLLNLYKSMLKMRICEESLVNPIIEREIQCPCHLYSGEEAIAASFGELLEKEDYVLGNHRSHGHYLAKGGNLKEMIAEIFCKDSGCSRGKGGSMHLIDTRVGMLGSAPIVAGTISLALGVALASKIRKDNRVSVSFFGDGATGEGVLYESLNFAALNKLPIIFACENNFYSTHLHIKEIRVENDIKDVGSSLGIQSYLVDGNDVLETYKVIKESVDLIKNGNGPVFIEFHTYRLRGHVGPDDNLQGEHTDIRPKEEIEAWVKKDPVIRIEKYLLENNLLDDNEKFEIKKQIEIEINEAIDFAKNSPYPDVKELYSNVFK
ncbi:MAG: thiamine pyrophosphate-dependent dehydrogenase E1 component subunit alpha [Pseudomonadota bacterium]